MRRTFPGMKGALRDANYFSRAQRIAVIGSL